MSEQHWPATTAPAFASTSSSDTPAPEARKPAQFMPWALPMGAGVASSGRYATKASTDARRAASTSRNLASCLAPSATTTLALLCSTT